MEKKIAKQPTLSVIVPITERYDSVKELFYEYKTGIEATGLSYEIIYVLDGDHAAVLEDLTQLQDSEKLTIITLARQFGEATALNAAFSTAVGSLLLTLPAYWQIQASEIPALVTALKECDMALARRWPRNDSAINRLQTRAFNFILRSFSSLKIHDAGCSARAFKRAVIEEVQLYGDLHRFFPIIAHRQGFKVIEIDIAQSSKEAFRRFYSPGQYVRRLLDMLTIFFLVKFTKKPLRFFGLVGSGLTGLGLAATLYLIIERLFFDVALADRPALVLSSLLIVLGIQVIAIGLIGEIIIFTHARDLKEYRIDRIIN
ncbi:MAG: glycosyltransferase [Gammaproteobacteria bacterium]